MFRVKWWDPFVGWRYSAVVPKKRAVSLAKRVGGSVVKAEG